jgi:AhpD family alkylhydroperoxidase
MPTQFRRRIYNINEFKTAIDDAFEHLPDMKRAMHAGRVDKAFSERIMLAVTQVNGCRYCSYGHTKAALSAGLSPEEIQALLAGEFSDAPQNQLPALMFAQHYAESEGAPDPEAWRQLVEFYGPETAQDILANIRMIMVGNLSGNTLDALWYRLTCRATAPNSNLLQEAGVIFGSLVIIPAAAIRYFRQRRRTRRMEWQGDKMTR